MTLEEYESLAHSNNLTLDELQFILDTNDIWNQEKTLNYKGWEI